MNRRKSTIKSSMSQGNQNHEKYNSYKAQQIEELKQIFKMYDRDNTGNITSRTLKFLLRGLGDNVNQEEVDAVLIAMDQDGNGTIDFQEFMSYMLEKVNNESLCDDIIDVFKIFDREATGFISITDIKIITAGLLDQQSINHFCEEADLEKEGQIDYKKFLNKLLK